MLKVILVARNFVDAAEYGAFGIVMTKLARTNNYHVKMNLGLVVGDGGNIFGYDPKRSGARGFHEGIFDEGFGGFSTLKKRNNALRSKRRPEMTSKGIHGDAFTG